MSYDEEHRGAHDECRHEIHALRAQLVVVTKERDDARQKEIALGGLLMRSLAHPCFEHADNCCATWCDKCIEGVAFKRELEKALGI